MANSSTVSSGEQATASQYNNLRDDVLSTTSGHLHDASNGRAHAEFTILAAEGDAAIFYMKADEGDDAGDEWKFNVADAGVMTIGNDIASAGTYVTHLTINPHATITSSSVTFPGILDVNGSVDWDVSDVQVDSSGDIDLVSTNDAAAAIYLRENAGTSGTIKIHSDQGTSVTEGAESINILSDAGGVGIRSTANLANAVNITVDGGTTSSMTLFNDQGTSATEGSASIQLLSDVGGINLKSGLNAANAILLTADGGTSEGILIHSDQGTGTASIKLLSDAGGITFTAGADIELDATNDVNIPANVGLTFGNDAEKIEGDGTDLTISGNNINLTATADVVIPANVGITFGSGEKIEGDSTDLTVTSGAKINLTATSDVHIPKNVGIVFDDNASEKIESNDTNLTINSGADINLTATSDINVPANVGITFGDDAEKIEGDGTDLTISGNIINLSGAVTATGILKTDDATEATSTTDGSLQTDGGLSVVKDAVFGDDLKLLSDSSVIAFGADGDTTLTHTDGTGLTLNSTNKLTFGDAATFIHQSSNGVMTVDGEATIDLNASTAVLVSNDLKLNSDSAVLGFGADNDTTLTHTDGTGLTLNSTNKLTFGDTGTFIHQSSDGVLTITSDTTVDINGAVAFDGAITGATNITLSGELDAATLDISGNADIDGTTNLDAVDIDGSVQIDGAVTIGVDDTGKDLKAYGATSGTFMLWDESDDELILGGVARMGIGTTAPDHLLSLANSAATSQIELRGGGTAGGGVFFSNYGNESGVMSTGVRVNGGSWTADTTAGGGSGKAAIYVQAGSTHYWYSNESTTDGSNISPGQVFTIINNGNATLAGTLTESSDVALKTNINTIDSALNKVNQMRGVSYDRIDTNISSTGLIAQELEKIAPELVQDNEEYKSVSYTKLTAYLVEAIKELSNKVKDLEAK